MRTYTELVKELNMATEIAVKNTAEQLLEVLKELINTEYYDQYTPSLQGYHRTFKFLESAVMKMLTSNSASIGIDEAYFNYQYPARYTSTSANENLSKIGQSYSGHWTGEDQIIMSSQGYHGNAYIRTEGRWWDSFVAYCEKNAVDILKQELRKQNLNVR